MLELLMLKGKLFLTVAGLVLGAAGLALFNFGAKPTPTVAQSTNYTTHWSATKLFQIKYTNNAGATVNTAAIGVSQWSVDGSIGPTSFTETWISPDPDSARLTISTNCSTNGYVRTDWLLGCFMVDSEWGGTHNFRLLSVDADSVYTSGNTTAARWSGGGAFCDNGGVLSGCVIGTGTYGFTVVPGTSGNTHESKLSGLMMPLKWTVSGTIN
ncbi:MAG: hypothetical protein WD970_03250 [Patescibacteria group bacterium]